MANTVQPLQAGEIAQRMLTLSEQIWEKTPPDTVSLIPVHQMTARIVEIGIVDYTVPNNNND